MPVDRREERFRDLKDSGADRVWQPILDTILETYRNFDNDSSRCNVILLTTERNHFHDFYVYYLEPALPKGVVYWSNWMSGFWLKKKVETVREKIVFLQDELEWLEIRSAPKRARAKSLRDLLESARAGRKFLILCGYNYETDRFRELLSLAFPEHKLEIKELMLKKLS